MAFLLGKTSLSSALRLRSQGLQSIVCFNLFGAKKLAQRAEDSLAFSRRGFHVELGAREKALLAEDPSLKRFKSHKKGLQQLKTVGNVLTLVVVAGCCYEIYDRTVTREESRKQAKKSL